MIEVANFWKNKSSLNRALEKVALETKSRRGSMGSYEFLSLILVNTEQKYFQ